MKPISAFCFALFFQAVAWTAAAQETDPHEIYEKTCAGCHAPHAGEFVPESTIRDDAGVLVGKSSGTPVAGFLKMGHGRLTEQEIEILMDHFLAIEEAGGLFMKKCRICHGRAVDLARGKLILRDGELYGRYTGREVSVFLLSHGQLAAGDVPVIVNMLKRQLTVR